MSATLARARSLASEAIEGLRFFADVVRLARRPVSAAAARAEVGRRLRDRSAGFLALARPHFAPAAGSPYARLLEHAGCRYGDLESLVRREGLEEALRRLCAAGIFLTGDELRGRAEVARGSLRFTVRLEELATRARRGRVAVSSSGSRGPGTVVALDLAFVRELTVDQALHTDLRGGQEWRNGFWNVPGGALITQSLRTTFSGQAVDRWFYTIDPGAPGLDPRYRHANRATLAALRTAGICPPETRFVPLRDPEPIARWMAETLEAGRVPHLTTPVSAAVTLAQAALAAGISLEGAQLTVGGEPVSEARLTVIRRTGAEPVPRYGNTEAGGVVAQGCLRPRSVGELHVLSDVRALIQPGDGSGDPRLPADALLVTSLLPSTPLALLNVSLGDRAVLGRRSCGCPLEEVGWVQHLEHLESFEKLTAHGISLPDVAIARTLEEVLPRRFGGGPTDYQLVERQAGDGRPALGLRVHPDVGPVDEAELRRIFLDSVGSGSGPERIIGLLWDGAGSLAVERRAPARTRSGKVLHLWSGVDGG